MWTEKSGRKTRLCTTYVDPLTGSRHKIGVTIEKDTPQQRNRAKEELDALVSRKTSVVPVSMSFKKLTELYKTDQALTLKKSTCTRNEYACKAFRKMFGDDCDVSKLTAGIVKQRMIEYRDKKAAAQEEELRKIEERKDRLHQNYLRRKANGSQKKWEEKYKPIREARKAKQKAELDATSPKYVRSQYYDMRLVTRTEADMPEGMIGYDADEVVRKANAAKNEKEAVAI